MEHGQRSCSQKPSDSNYLQIKPHVQQVKSSSLTKAVVAWQDINHKILTKIRKLCFQSVDLFPGPLYILVCQFCCFHNVCLKQFIDILH
jgi:hypothetical protein